MEVCLEHQVGLTCRLSLALETRRPPLCFMLDWIGKAPVAAQDARGLLSCSDPGDPADPARLPGLAISLTKPTKRER